MTTPNTITSPVNGYYLSILPPWNEKIRDDYLLIQDNTNITGKWIYDKREHEGQGIRMEYGDKYFYTKVDTSNKC